MLDLCAALTPLALLPNALLLRFVGCTATATGTGTVFQLDLDSDLQKPMPADSRQVKRITVYWSIWNGGSLLRTVPPGTPNEINPENPPFLDPTLDQGAEYPTRVNDLITADHVSCSCELILGTSADSSSDENVTVHSTPFVLDPAHTKYVFTLTPKPNKVTGKRDFVLREYSL
jgi:hypothetical protein